VVVELEVGDARSIALLERRRLGIERNAVQAIIDLARLRGRRDLRQTPWPEPAGIIEKHEEYAQQPCGSAGSAVTKPQQQIVVAECPQQCQPVLPLRRLAARSQLDSMPCGCTGEVEHDQRRKSRGQPANERKPG